MILVFLRRVDSFIKTLDIYLTDVYVSVFLEVKIGNYGMLLKGRRVINITDELNQKIVKQALWLRVRVARSSKRGT